MDPSTTHRLKLSRAGYLPTTFALALEKGVVTQRQIVLLPALGEVDVQVAPDNATVAVNGEDRGAGNQILSLPSVEQVITIAAPGYASVERRVRLVYHDKLFYNKFKFDIHADGDSPCLGLL